MLRDPLALSEIEPRPNPPPGQAAVYLFQRATQLYYHQQNRGRLWLLLARALRRPPRLLELEHLCATCRLERASPLGLKTVELSRICGTEARTADFSSRFHAVRSHLRPRWVNVALLLLQNQTAPAVQLFQVRDSYFVRDGHHRVSVMRALGYAYVDAEVTLLEMAACREQCCPGALGMCVV